MEPFRPKDTLLGPSYIHDHTAYNRTHAQIRPVRNAPRSAWNPTRYLPTSTRYLPKQRIIIPHGVRVTLRIPTLLVSLAVVGVLAHTIYIRESTRGERLVYPLGTTIAAWPHALTMHPTLLLLAAAAVAVLFNLVALASLAGFNKFRTTGCGTFLTNVSLLIGLATWIAVVVYFKLWDTGKVRMWDLWSRACTHQQFEIRDGNKQIGFGTICTEMRFAYYGGVGVTVLEGLNLMAFGVNKLGDLSDRRKNKGQDLRPLMTGHGYEKVGGGAAMIGA